MKVVRLGKLCEDRKTCQRPLLVDMTLWQRREKIMANKGKLKTV